jgi:hypothetical protein
MPTPANAVAADKTISAVVSSSLFKTGPPKGIILNLLDCGETTGRAKLDIAAKTPSN